MRHFNLLNFQHIVLYVFPTLIFMVVFGLALAFSHLRSEDAEARKQNNLPLPRRDRRQGRPVSPVHDADHRRDRRLGFLLCFGYRPVGSKNIK